MLLEGVIKMDAKKEHVSNRAACPICGRELNEKEAAQFNTEGKFECGDCGATVAPSGAEEGAHFENHGCGCGGSCGCGGHHH